LAICPNMKKCNLEKIRDVLLRMDNVVTVEEGIADKARGCIERMLAVG